MRPMLLPTPRAHGAMLLSATAPVASGYANPHRVVHQWRIAIDRQVAPNGARRLWEQSVGERHGAFTATIALVTKGIRAVCPLSPRSMPLCDGKIDACLR